jgi:hypothetical protein
MLAVLAAGSVAALGLVSIVEVIASSMLDRPSAPAPWCMGCGYDLRGLPANSACPECGQRFKPARPRQGADIAQAFSMIVLVGIWILIVCEVAVFLLARP